MISKKNSAFTPEQMEVLSGNRWVRKVTRKTLIFTDEFKWAYWQLKQSGRTSRQALLELGVDPKLLGRTRVEGILITVKNFVAKQSAATATDECAPSVVSDSPAAQLTRLQHRLEYAEQQIEFIKKTILLGREAGQRR